MAALIMSMAQSMQISEIADMIGEHDTRVWRVVKYYVEDALTLSTFKEDHYDIPSIESLKVKVKVTTTHMK